MKGTLELVDKNYIGNDHFFVNESIDGYYLNVFIDDNSLDILKDKESFINDTKYEKNDIVDYITTNFNNILNEVDYVVLRFENIDDYEFITNNKELLNKKIVLSSNLCIDDYDKICELYDRFKDIKENIYVIFEGNSEYVNLLKCYETITKIRKYSEDVKNMNLSPMETIMYVYDDLKERIYKVEDDNEDNKTSRDLSEVVSGDKIVCEGYANIFSSVLNYLGYVNKKVYLEMLDKEDIGHVRNCVYVNDPKYQIDGVYYFDATFDSKSDENDESYLYKYRYFAKTKKQMDAVDKFSFMPDALYNDMEDVYNSFIAGLAVDDTKALSEAINMINPYGRMVGKDKLVDIMKIHFGKFDVDEFKNEYMEVMDKFNRPIPTEIMIVLFNNVRKLRYYNSNKVCYYSLSDMYTTYIYSKWGEFNSDKKALLLRLLFEEDFDFGQESFKDIIERNNIDKKINQTQLTKCLKLYLDTKK